MSDRENERASERERGREREISIVGERIRFVNNKINNNNITTINSKNTKENEKKCQVVLHVNNNVNRDFAWQ